MPANRQSIAGSLLQTLARLCTSVGYGIATAIFNAVQSNPASKGYYAHNAIEPFAACFWFSAGAAAVGCCFVPWLRIGTQGHKGDVGRVVQRSEQTSEGKGMEHSEKGSGVFEGEKGMEKEI
jgi:hypothetical protein